MLELQKFCIYIKVALKEDYLPLLLDLKYLFLIDKWVFKTYSLCYSTMERSYI